MAHQLILISLLIHLISTDPLDKLYSTLTANYSLAHIPSYPEQAVVNVSAYLDNIAELNQASNTIRVSAGLRLAWFDRQLRWNPAEHDDIRHALVPHKHFWTPELVILHRINKELLETMDSTFLVDHEGRVNQTVMFTSSTFCGIDVKLFPFDKQKCEILIASSTRRASSLIFHTRPDIDLEQFYDNQEHVLVGAKMHTDEAKIDGHAYSVVLIELYTERQSFYYVFILVLPTSFITLVALVAFHCSDSVRGDRTAKYQIGTITLLSMSVILVGFSQQLPKFSLKSVPGQRGSFSSVPLLGIYYISLLVLIMVGTIQSSLFVQLERYLNSKGKNASTSVRRLEILSFTVYLLLLLSILLLFFFHDWY